MLTEKKVEIIAAPVPQTTATSLDLLVDQKTQRALKGNIPRLAAEQGKLAALERRDRFALEQAVKLNLEATDIAYAGIIEAEQMCQAGASKYPDLEPEFTNIAERNKAWMAGLSPGMGTAYLQRYFEHTRLAPARRDCY